MYYYGYVTNFSFQISLDNSILGTHVLQNGLFKVSLTQKFVGTFDILIPVITKKRIEYKKIQMTGVLEFIRQIKKNQRGWIYLGLMKMIEMERLKKAISRAILKAKGKKTDFFILVYKKNENDKIIPKISLYSLDQVSNSVINLKKQGVWLNESSPQYNRVIINYGEEEN
jgi:hypothetical protein